MIIDGKAIAENIYTQIRARVALLGRTPVLTILTCAPNFETQKYLTLKRRKAEGCGITIRVIELPASSTTETFCTVITETVADSDGIIVQLPLPSEVDVGVVLAHIPPSHDVDVLNEATSSMISPVTLACVEIITEHSVPVHDSFVTIIGSGRLVGLPVYQWFTLHGAHTSVVTKDTIEIEHYTRNADIIVCGAGVPGLLTPEMIKEGVVILDAGTSEDGGELRGDADPRCAEKASFFTPVPGGIGPITIAMLLKNVVDCATAKKPVV